MNAADLYSPHDARPGIPPARVPWGAVAVFVVLAVGLGWLVCLPLWLGEGLASPQFQLFATALMATPTIAALIVVFAAVPKGARARYLGLMPFRPVARKIWVIVLWPFLFLAVAFAALLLASLFGWVDVDPALAAVQQNLDMLGVEMDAGLYVAMQFVMLPIVLVQASAAAFGEELGWRGYLTTALSPMGFWPSAIVIGVIWGAWHAPIILLGYNFGRTDALGVVFMIVFCLLLSVILQWSRYFTRSVWPAAVGHGALNTAFVYPMFWVQQPDPLLGSAVGVPGWIVLAIVIVAMVAARAFRPGPDWTPRVAPVQAPLPQAPDPRP